MPLLDMKSVRSGNMKLVGTFKTRDEARRAYTGLVDDLNACEDGETLEIYIISISDVILQYRRAMPHYWFGDGDDFLGLEREIELARERIEKLEFGMFPDGDTARLFAAHK